MKMKLEKKSLSVIDILLVAFIILKLIGIINWSWVLVLIPLWIKLVGVGIIYLCFWIKFGRYLK